MAKFKTVLLILLSFQSPLAIGQDSLTMTIQEASAWMERQVQEGAKIKGWEETQFNLHWDQHFQVKYSYIITDSEGLKTKYRFNFFLDYVDSTLLTIMAGHDNLSLSTKLDRREINLYVDTEVKKGRKIQPQATQHRKVNLVSLPMPSPLSSRKAKEVMYQLIAISYEEMDNRHNADITKKAGPIRKVILPVEPSAPGQKD